MDPGAAAEATRRYFHELPRIVKRVLGDWASRTHVEMRRLPSLPGEVRRSIEGEARMIGGTPFAYVGCASEIGLYLERGTGIYGPYKRPIRAKGGAYTDAHGRHRKRRMLRWKGTTYSASSTEKRSASIKGGGVSYRETVGAGASYKASKGYIYAYEVKGMKPRPWFFPTIKWRLPLLKRSLHATMERATEAIRNGGLPFRQVISFG